MMSMPLQTSRVQEQVGSLAACPHEWSDFDTCQLLDLARRSVLLGFEGETPLRLLLEHYSLALQRRQSTFVTLRDRETVISRAGTVRPVCPLASDVCHNAYEAARHAVQIAPDAELTCDVQVVSPLRYLNVSSWEDVRKTLQEGQDGLHVQHGSCSATFTPDKWQQWPEADGFLKALQHQAGLDPACWQPGVRVATYQLTQFPRITVPIPLQTSVRKPK